MAAQHTQRSLLVQMSGAPGSGKSTMASLLRQSLGGVVVDHDVLRSAFLESDVGFAQAALHAYKLQWTLAADFMRQGLTVIIDSTCNFQQVPEQGAALAEEHGYTYWYVECRVGDIDVLDERLRARKPMTSQRTGVDRPPNGAPMNADQNGRALFAKWIEAPCRPKDNVVIVDATGAPGKLRDDILKQISG